MKDDDRFAGPGAKALNEPERESAVKLACELTAEEVCRGPIMSGEAVAAKDAQLKTGRCEREVFGRLFLTIRHRLINDEALFYGTIDRAGVYTRVPLQKALEYNAAAVILFHNHPSGTAEQAIAI